MKKIPPNWKKIMFFIAFLGLTVPCWCPIGYGSYGPVGRIMGMPSWAAMMLFFGAILFILEWVFLFRTDLALYDQDLSEVVSELESVSKGGLEW